MSSVDDGQWRKLQEDLRTGYQDLRHAIETHSMSSVEATSATIGTIAHAAYHLGAIRQKAAFAKTA